MMTERIALPVVQGETALQSLKISNPLRRSGSISSMPSPTIKPNKYKLLYLTAARLPITKARLAVVSYDQLCDMKQSQPHKIR